MRDFARAVKKKFALRGEVKSLFQAFSVKCENDGIISAIILV